MSHVVSPLIRRLQAAVATAAALIAPAAVVAGTNTWTSTTVSPGVVWKWQVYTNLYGGQQTVNVLQVSLANAQVQVKPIWSSSGCATTSALGSGSGALAAINGGFFDGTCASVSMFKLAGTVSATNPGWKPARATLGINQTTKTPYIDWIASTDSWSAVNDALGGGPNLVSNGAVDVTWSDEGFDSSYTSRNPRTAVGFTSSNTLIMVTVDGRTSAGLGMTLSELASYMVSLGCDEAMNLDGGGSTTMWLDGQGVVNTPSDGSQRAVKTALGVYYVENATIVDNGTSGHTETGTWTSSANAGFYGSNSRWASTAASATATATWTPNLTAGTYEVYAWWVAGSNRANNAVYQITHGNGVSNIPANQTANGAKWNLLGTYSFNAGTGGKVVLGNNAELSKVVSADAIKWVYVGPPEVIVDNTATTTVKSGNWFTSTSTAGYYGANYHTRATASVSDAFTWRADLPIAGSYQVYARWTTASNRATAAPYVVVHTGGNTTVTVNQQQNNGTWVLLGTYNFNAGLLDRVRLSCWTNTGQYVVADAVKFVKTP